MARIISLDPGATEIVCALNMGSSLVGRSHLCDFPSSVKKLPFCTASFIRPDQKSADINLEIHRRAQKRLPFVELKWDVIKQLNPDVILTQTQCQACFVNVKEVHEGVRSFGRADIQIVDLKAHRLSEVWKNIEQVGAALDMAAMARQKINKLTQKIETIFNRSKDESFRPTVVAIEWIDPLMVAGNWMPELIELVGGKPLFKFVGEPSSWITWEQLQRANPEIIVVSACGFSIDRARNEMLPLTSRSGWYDLEAVQNNRVFLLPGQSFFHRAGPRLVEALEILAEIIHPDIFDFGHKHENWQYWGFDRVE